MAFLKPEEIAKKLPLEEGLIVADFGSGVGSFTVPVAKRVGASGHVYAVEINKELVGAVKAAASREKLSNVEVIWGDIEAPNGTRLSDSSVGLVILANVLFQVENKEGVLKEVTRILKTRGYALVLDWKESFGGLGPKQGDVVSEGDARKLFLNSGFSLYNEIEAGEYHYALLFQKF
ncbi:MAG: methyltransferase domain-containing protein [Candidatus Paceibacterota bacterium]|jgi:ubiquinone/menaquinone biosynthesis C-methylase UbiE